MYRVHSTSSADMLLQIPNKKYGNQTKEKVLLLPHFNSPNTNATINILILAKATASWASYIPSSASSPPPAPRLRPAAGGGYKWGLLFGRILLGYSKINKSIRKQCVRQSPKANNFFERTSDK